jgi:predicted O-methyltransferase YrrM
LKDRVGALVHAEQERYLERLLPPRDAVVAEMERQAAAEGIPISDPEVGRLLAVLARATRARRIVEVGCAIGYGALHLARGAPEAQVVTIDADETRLERARAFLDEAGVAERVELVHGSALEVLARLDGTFDLAYVDAAKTEYRHYLDLLLPKMSQGGTLVFDNLLWKGRVAADGEDGEEEDEATAAIRAFNPYLMMHPQMSAVILPLGDGVGLATKIKPTILEQGGPW